MPTQKSHVHNNLTVTTALQADVIAQFGEWGKQFVSF